MKARAWERHSSCGTLQPAWQLNVQHRILIQTNSSRGTHVFLGMDTAHWGSHTSREQDFKRAGTQMGVGAGVHME